MDPVGPEVIHDLVWALDRGVKSEGRPVTKIMAEALYVALAIFGFELLRNRQRRGVTCGDLRGRVANTSSSRSKCARGSGECSGRYFRDSHTHGRID